MSDRDGADGGQDHRPDVAAVDDDRLRRQARRRVLEPFLKEPGEGRLAVLTGNESARLGDELGERPAWRFVPWNVFDTYRLRFEIGSVPTWTRSCQVSSPRWRSDPAVRGLPSPASCLGVTLAPRCAGKDGQGMDKRPSPRTSAPEKSASDLRRKKQPQRGSNPCLHLERVVS